MKKYGTAIVVALGLAVATAGPAHPQAGALTGAALISQLRSMVADITASAHSLIDHGNIALAQQQMLLAGILEGTIDQVEKAYSDSLDKTFDHLSVAEQNTFTDLREQVEGVKGLVDTGNSHLSDRIYQTQGATNQILNRLPHTVAYPVFYGVSVGDLSPGNGVRPSDIEILGFQLSDARLDRKSPIIKVAGQQISAPNVSVREDRVEVQIPPDLKEKIGLEDTPCNPRQSFPIEMTVFYSVKHGIGFFSRIEEKSVSFNANALPGVDKYDVTVSYSGTKSDTSWTRESFRTRPTYRNMGCEDTTSASARFEAPEGSRRLQCDAAWVDTSNVKNQSANCAVGGRVATGTGSMRGRDREWTGNCPGGGHGSFTISGTYEVPNVETARMSSVPRSFVTSAPLGMTSALGIDPSLSDVVVDVAIARHSCPAELDHITIPAVRQEMRYDQPSDNGGFKAVLQNGSIRISE